MMSISISTAGKAYISHGHPDLKTHKPSNNHTNIDDMKNTFRLQPPPKKPSPPRPKQKLHHRCTVKDCGTEFDTFADLDNHTNTAHSEILDIPVRLAQGISEQAEPKMLNGAIITKVTRDFEPATKNGGNEEQKPPTPPAEEDVDKALTATMEAKATEARPTLARWTSRMNRNAMANPGASEWKSL